MRILRHALVFLFIALPLYALELPAPRGYVNDYAALLSPAMQQKIERYLQNFEASDSTQIVVVTVPTLQGEPIEQAALAVAEAWKIGQAKKDNGALLFIAKDDRKMRIEVGRGLEGRLTDLLAGRIVDNEIAPRFKQGDFDGGVAAGVQAMAEAVRGEYQGTGKARRQKSDSPLIFLFPLLFFVLPLFFRLGGGRGHRHGPGGFWIGGPGGGGFSGGGGFGGFSGGGGGFSGGGSSGSW